jgi:hypothetical protein
MSESLLVTYILTDVLYFTVDYSKLNPLNNKNVSFIQNVHSSASSHNGHNVCKSDNDCQVQPKTCSFLDHYHNVLCMDGLSYCYIL